MRGLLWIISLHSFSSEMLTAACTDFKSACQGCQDCAFTYQVHNLFCCLTR